MKTLKTILLLALAPVLSLAQVPAPAAPATVPTPAEAAPATPAPVAPVANVAVPQDLFNSSKLIDKSDDMGFDADSGVFTWKGKSFDVGSSRMFRARFERYLMLTESDIDQQRTYRKLINDVLVLLSPQNLQDSNTNLAENINTAYNKLYEASSYPQDGGVSKVLAHMLYNTWRLRDELKADNLALTEAEKKAIRQQADEDFRSRTDAWEKDRKAIEMHNRGVTSNSATTPPTIPSTSGLTGSAATRAGMAATSTSIAVKGNLAKFQFQSQIVYLMLNRRFEHAIMASNFYRLIFKSSSQRIEVGLDLLEKFLPKGDLVYTVEALEQVSQEALNDVAGTMQTVNASFDEKDMTACLERLQENFILGEFMEPVTSFSTERRRAILTYHRQLRQAREFVTLKDYERLLSVANTLRQSSNDFRFSEVQSLAQAGMQASDFALASGKMQLARNDFAGAQAAFKQAGEFWPLNPQLQSLTKLISEQTDAALQLTGKFDDLLKQENFREIFKLKHELGGALANDPARLPQLKDVLDKVAKVEGLLTQANTLLSQQNTYAAWDMVLEAEKLLPKDADLLNLKIKLMPQVDNYVSFIRKAAEAEQVGNLTVSLSYYLQALEIYPASVNGNEGKKRLGERLLQVKG